MKITQKFDIGSNKHHVAGDVLQDLQLWLTCLPLVCVCHAAEVEAVGAFARVSSKVFTFFFKYEMMTSFATAQ